MEISILPNLYLKEDGTFNKDKAINLCGKIAGVCYNPEGFEALVNEDEEATNKRIKLTLGMGHHSVYDHVLINFNFKKIPKILAMIINNEKQYTTSEKSARYTEIKRGDGSVITEKEEELYNKWMEIFKVAITEKYGDIYKAGKIKKLAQENARYLITVFMPTEMIYSTSLRQINYLASWMKEFIEDKNNKNELAQKLIPYMKIFISELERLNVLESNLMENEKKRKLSLFATRQKDTHYSDLYTTNYKGSFAELAQAQRHRTIHYELSLLKDNEYFVPPIIEDNKKLATQWINDISSLRDVYPQGMLINICEQGKYEDFILKAKERLCSAAQLEIRNQTKQTLTEYEKALSLVNHPLAKEIKAYTRGARCTFKDYTCNADCNFKEGKILVSKI